MSDFTYTSPLIQNHQAREQKFHGPVLFLHPCRELNLGPPRNFQQLYPLYYLDVRQPTQSYYLFCVLGESLFGVPSRSRRASDTPWPSPPDPRYGYQSFADLRASQTATLHHSPTPAVSNQCLAISQSINESMQDGMAITLTKPLLSPHLELNNVRERTVTGRRAATTATCHTIYTALNTVRRERSSSAWNFPGVGSRLLVSPSSLRGSVKWVPACKRL